MARDLRRDIITAAELSHLEFVDGIDPRDLSALFGNLEMVRVDEGGQLEMTGENLHCALVLRGRLALDYDGAVDRRRTVTLVEEGDIILRGHPSGSTPRFSVRALDPSRLVLVTNERFSQWQRHPTLVMALVRQLTAQICDRELAAATALEPRVEHRLLMKLTQLAERFGRVTPQGLRLDLQLTHQQLADMVGAVRESVTIAMGRLAANGALIVDNRTIWLPHGPDTEAGVMPDEPGTTPRTESAAPGR